MDNKRYTYIGIPHEAEGNLRLTPCAPCTNAMQPQAATQALPSSLRPQKTLSRQKRDARNRNRTSARYRERKKATKKWSRALSKHTSEHTGVRLFYLKRHPGGRCWLGLWWRSASPRASGRYFLGSVARCEHGSHGIATRR